MSHQVQNKILALVHFSEIEMLHWAYNQDQTSIIFCGMSESVVLSLHGHDYLIAL